MSVPENGVSDPIVWVDCEMTGLDLAKDALIEIAVVVTDSDLTPLGDGIDLVVKPPAEALAQMSDFVRQMHTTSGLLERLATGVTLAQAQSQVMAYVRQYVSQEGKAPLAGNSVSTDRGFIDRDLPELGSHLHYRNIDVSSVKELARRWYPRLYFAAPEKLGGHRALLDIHESINELRYYRATMFVAEPGPDSDTARAAALAVQENAIGGPPSNA
ncbi:MAG: oligoribonuclease [Propionibacteriaceae bacterium]|jgi:oligoribonuclease|nr:oligoribonuclease [Propionibacteriaceae bacterium]